MLFQVQRYREETDWQPYRDGQKFRDPNAALRLVFKLMDRGVPEEKLRIIPLNDPQP